MKRCRSILQGNELTVANPASELCADAMFLVASQDGNRP